MGTRMKAKACVWEGSPAYAIELDGKHVGLVRDAGHEIARRWNAHDDLLALADRVAAVDVFNPGSFAELRTIKDAASAAIVKALGVS